jgi:hypothetical protein
MVNDQQLVDSPLPIHGSCVDYVHTEKISIVLVRKRPIPTERRPLVGEVSANFCGQKVSRGQRNGSPRPYSRFCRPEPLLFHPKLYSRGWVDPVPNPLLLRKSGRARTRTRDLWICSQELWPLDHRGGSCVIYTISHKWNIVRFPQSWVTHQMKWRRRRLSLAATLVLVVHIKERSDSQAGYVMLRSKEVCLKKSWVVLEELYGVWYIPLMPHGASSTGVL